MTVDVGMITPVIPPSTHTLLFVNSVSILKSIKKNCCDTYIYIYIASTYAYATKIG